MYAEIVKFMEEDSNRVHPGVDHLFIARGLERLADHATNIAKDVLFFVQGVDVWHHAEESPPIQRLDSRNAASSQSPGWKSTQSGLFHPGKWDQKKY